MTLSATLANAMTGLNAASRQADLIANNVANALTEGYGRRQIELSPLQLAENGQGVRVVGISRVSDPIVTGTRRLAQAEAGQQTTLADAQARLSGLLGAPGEPGALATLADAFDTALNAAADTPESATLLSAAQIAASDVARAFNTASNDVQQMRGEADAQINRNVDLINTKLAEVEKLNDTIQINTFTGSDIAALQDQRQRAVDQISDLIPIKVIQRDNNKIALVTPTGAVLLDGLAAEIEFTPTQIVTQDQTLASGALSGLTVNGQNIPIGQGDGKGVFDGGVLEAQFAVRDQIAPEFAVELDALARNLIERVQGLPEDPTLGAGDAGLFTDGGAAFDPLNEEAIARRIQVNPAVDPSQGGDPTLLRDGLNAAGPGDVGDPTVLRGLQDALTAAVPILSGAGFTGSLGFASFTTQLSSQVLFDSVDADARAADLTARLDTVSDAETNLVGVDTDAELARLLVVEQAFSANARVIQVVDELLERLLLI